MFDDNCLDLAELFLENTPFDTDEQAQRLAQEIQDTIEGFLRYAEHLASSPSQEPRP